MPYQTPPSFPDQDECSARPEDVKPSSTIAHDTSSNTSFIDSANSSSPFPYEQVSPDKPVGREDAATVLENPIDPATVPDNNFQMSPLKDYIDYFLKESQRESAAESQRREQPAAKTTLNTSAQTAVETTHAPNGPIHQLKARLVGEFMTTMSRPLYRPTRASYTTPPPSANGCWEAYQDGITVNTVEAEVLPEDDNRHVIEQEEGIESDREDLRATSSARGIKHYLDQLAKRGHYPDPVAEMRPYVHWGPNAVDALPVEDFENHMKELEQEARYPNAVANIRQYINWAPGTEDPLPLQDFVDCLEELEEKLRGANLNPTVRLLAGQKLGNKLPKLPKPMLFENYWQPVWKGHTYNGLVALAILRIAQKRLNFVDFSFALDHLPNIEPSQPHPHPDLFKSWSFLDDNAKPARHPGARQDVQIQVLFLPRFFEPGFFTDDSLKGGLNCIGFCVTHGSGPYDPEPDMLFTPCTMTDLEECGLVRSTEPGRPLRLTPVASRSLDVIPPAYQELNAKDVPITPKRAKGKAVLAESLKKSYAQFSKQEITSSGRWITKFHLINGTVGRPNREYSYIWRCVTQG